jgi:hypothetical protein
MQVQNELDAVIPVHPANSCDEICKNHVSIFVAIAVHVIAVAACLIGAA